MTLNGEETQADRPAAALTAFTPRTPAKSRTSLLVIV